MAEALRLAAGARGSSAPNPNVGCVILADGAIVGRGATAPGGRPHAEAIALAEAGSRAAGAALFVTLEPCAHASERGLACADLIAASGVARVVMAMEDPDPRTAGKGADSMRGAGIAVEEGLGREEAALAMAGWLMRQRLGRPYVTLKLAMSIDGRIAMANGTSRWISGEESRTHAHRLRAESDMILVGRGTYATDNPRLDVRLPGLEDRSPRRALLTSGAAPDGWARIGAPGDIAALEDVNDLLVEGGAGAAAAFLAADLVDRLIVYRAPILIGEGRVAIDDLGLAALSDAHGRWRCTGRASLGTDGLEVYERVHPAIV